MKKILLQSLLLSSLIVLGLACEKGEEPFPTSEPETRTLVRLPQADGVTLRTLALDLTPGTSVINVLEIRREATGPADLNRRLVVKIQKSNGVLSDATGGEVRELPETLYSAHPDNPFDGQYWTVTFEPGEYVKQLKILLDPSPLISLGYRVGLGFQIADAQGAEISEGANKLAVEISAKNQYDGRYALTWTNYHPTANPGYTGSTTEIQMHTTGNNKVKSFWPLAGTYCAPSILNGGLSYFLAQEPEYVVAGNNSVTVQNAAPGGTIVYQMSAGFNSRYEPGSKTFFVKWGYNMLPGGVFDPANTREWTQTAVYLGPR